MSDPVSTAAASGAAVAPNPGSSNTGRSSRPAPLAFIGKMTPAQQRWTKRVCVALLLFFTVMAIEHSGLLERAFGSPGYVYAEFVLYLIPYLIAGYDVLAQAVRGIINRQPFDESLLMSIATIGAFGLVLFPDAGPHMAEGAAVMLFYQVGEIFQSYAMSKSRNSIKAMMDIAPDFANVMRAGQLVQVDPYELAPGDEFVVRPGERIPLDAVIVEGSSDLDTAALTGESVPRHVEPGDGVISGCVNMTGLLTARATKAFEESTVSRILELVERSGDKKARTENFITRFARVYTPIVTLLALLIAVLPPLALGLSWSDWIFRGLTFLVVSCPCALVISVPLSFFGGIGGASKLGILAKGGNHLEVLAHTSTVVFDKTGTLTSGSFEVVQVLPAGPGRVAGADTSGAASSANDPGAAASADASDANRAAAGVAISPEELLRLAAHAEGFSTHPIAQSIRTAYGQEIHTAAVSGVRELGGHGVTAQFDGHALVVGNARLFEDQGIVLDALAAADGTGPAGTLVHVACDGRYAGTLVIADVLKPDAAAAIADLRASGVGRTVMLTGDRAETAAAVAAELGIDEYHSQLLPQDKVARVEEILDEAAHQAGRTPGTSEHVSLKHKVAFVGDGINDAPVLMRADVGIAMGAMGSDAAIEAADIVLMDDKPSKIATAIRIARKTMAIVWQNIILALGVKVLVLILAAFGLANMWIAVFADVGVATLAILNAMRCMQVEKLLK